MQRPAKMPTTHKRQTPRRKLVSLNVDTAREAIGSFTPDTEIYGVTRGEISLTDILAHIMSDTDARDLTLATWTAAAGSLTVFADMARAKAIRSLRLIVDPSFVTRKPADCELVHTLFGSEAIRCVPLHAKFAVFSGGRLPVTLRTSMNLNPNSRLESYEISTCPEMAAYHLKLSDDIFEQFAVPKPGQWQSNSRGPLKQINSTQNQKPLF